MLDIIQMTKMFLHNRFQAFFTVLICFIAITTLVRGEDRFAVTVGAHDHLVIFGPKGERAAEISVPTIAQPVSVGDVSFQVSYGQDANGRLTAILTPGSVTQADLHFTVLGKSVDAEGAVVTLIFSSNLKSVTIDPGYVGNVEVNSRWLGHRHLADDMSAPSVTAPTAPVPLSTASTAPSDSALVASVTPVAPAPAPAVSTETAPESSSETASSVLPHAPATLASQLAPSMLDQGNSTSVADSSAVKTPPASTATAPTTTTAAKGQIKLYWSEPVTPPNGPAPAVGLDEIKLVEVYGPVIVTLPNGETKTGVDGMIVPSGSSVMTQVNASAALFMGGINSARLMPQCDLTVTQSFDGIVRKDTLDLRRGAVFSRVGQRSGETQDYQVRTPEGATDAESTDMLAYRGTPDYLQGATTTMNTRLAWDRKQLLAWSPVSLDRGLIRDVADSLLAIPKLTSPSVSTYFYYVSTSTSSTPYPVSTIKQYVITSGQAPGQNAPAGVVQAFENANNTLQTILKALQPYNVKLNTLINAVNNGTASPSDLAYYHNLITVFFNQQMPSIPSNLRNKDAIFAAILQAEGALRIDLAAPSLTPH